MYQEVFDGAKQAEMRRYFQQVLGPLGVIKKYPKNHFIDSRCCQSVFGIVMEGKVVKSIVSAQGQEKMLYILRPGEIFGEMNLLGGGTLNYMIRVKEDSRISYISREILTQEVDRNPIGYTYLMHSMTRKFRIVLLQSTNTVFNDSKGRIAEALIRLSACSEDVPGKQDAAIISTAFTQNELAHNIGCSRITVTRVLKEFAEKKLISICHKKIVIHDLEALADYTDRVQ